MTFIKLHTVNLGLRELTRVTGALGEVKHQQAKPRCHFSPSPRQNKSLNCTLSLHCLNFSGTKDPWKPPVKSLTWMPLDGVTCCGDISSCCLSMVCVIC